MRNLRLALIAATSVLALPLLALPQQTAAADEPHAGPRLFAPGEAVPTLRFEEAPPAAPHQVYQLPIPAEPIPLPSGPAIPLSPQGLAPAPLPRGGEGTFSPNYWIVSTRECPQRGAACATGECLRYFRKQCGQLHVRPCGMPEFLSSLDPSAPTCFFIHGSYFDWESVVIDSEATYRWIRKAAPDLPLNVVFFTWPSDDRITYVVPTFDIMVLGRRAARNSFYLARLISQLPPGQPVTLVGHSHGTRLASSTLHLLAGGQVDGYLLETPVDPTRRFRAVFAAAAIDHHWLNPGERYGRALARTEALLNVRNSQDMALSLYPLSRPFGDAALGRRGFTRRDRQELGYWNTKIAEIEVSPDVRHGHVWAHYLHVPGLAHMLVPYVYFVDGAPMPATSPMLGGPLPVDFNAQSVQSQALPGLPAPTARPQRWGQSSEPLPLPAVAPAPRPVTTARPAMPRFATPPLLRGFSQGSPHGN